MTIQLELRGTNRVANKFRRTMAKEREHFDPIIREHAQDERRALKSTAYPPKRPGQKYVRTGRLANSWAVVKVSDGVYRIVNRASGRSGQYAKYVVSTKQAWMHRGRWWIAKEEMEKRTPDLVKKLTRAVRRIWSGP